MSFAENLQYLRKQKDLTQEQLAEQLEVSRQSVSKWESSQSYPEMEKLLQICSMFHCSMDSLMQGDISQDFAQDSCGYDRVYNRFSRWITAGVALILTGIGLAALLEGAGTGDEICGAVFFAFLIVSVLILVVSGMQYNHFKEKNPWLEDFYTEEEKDLAYRRYTVRIALGVGIILVGVLFVIVAGGVMENATAGAAGELLEGGAVTGVGETLEGGAVIGTDESLKAGALSAAAAERLEDMLGGIFLLAVAVGVSFLVYGGMQKAKYDIDAYNRDANPSPERKRRSALTGKLCGCIMLASAIVYLVLDFQGGLWGRAWLVFAVGGILCGIVAIALSRDDRD